MLADYWLLIFFHWSAIFIPSSSRPVRRQETCWPNVGESLRMSTATSSTAPLTQRTSLLLGIWHALIMLASHHAVRWHRLVVLHEVDTMPKDGRYLLTFGLPPPYKVKFKQVWLCSCFIRRFIEFPLREALEEIAAGVFEYSGFFDEDAIELIILKFDNSGLIKD